MDSLSTSQQWNCSGGVLTQTTDASSQTTPYGYVNQSGTADPLWRRLSSTDSLGNVTWNTLHASKHDGVCDERKLPDV